MKFRFLCLAAFVQACSDPEPQPRVENAIDLLARTPDTTVWQAGELTPDPEKRWGRLGQFGWEAALSEGGGVPFVWTNREKAFLDLPASGSTERTLTLHLIAPTPEQKEVELKLNSVSIAKLQVGPKWQEEKLSLPAQSWIAGDNLLEIDCKLTPFDDARSYGIGLARAQYDARREVEFGTCDDPTEPAAHEGSGDDRRIVKLAPGTSVYYRVQPLTSGRIVLEANSSGAGQLTVTLAPIDAATGNGSGEPQIVRLPGAQSLERAYPLPVDGALAELRVSWDAHAASELTLTRLSLEETDTAARPPVILISVDTLSARHMSVYGYPLDTTPNLAKFAQDAYVFERCITNATWTLPSFMALMSGQYAAAHQLEAGGSELWEQWYLSQNRWTLPEFLRAAGYRTGGFVDNAWITSSFGFPQGFEVYDASAADNNASKLSDPEGGIRQTTREAREYLAGLNPREPFFLFVHCFDVHGPYAAPEPFDGSLDDSASYDQERAVFAGGPDNSFEIIPTYVARGELTKGNIPPRMKTAPFEAAYDAGVQFVDDELGKFFEHLRAAGVLERAWVIVTADHGETMADTSFYFGHGVLDQDVLQIPLLIRPPGGKSGGARIDSTVQLVDLYPTIAEIVGSSASRQHLHGQSLVPLFRGEARESDLALSESGPLRQAALIRGRWKLVELELSKEAHRQALLSYPFLTPEWILEAEKQMRHRITTQKDGLDGRTLAEREERLFGWRKDPALVEAFTKTRFETGLTDELFRRMMASPRIGSLVLFLQRALAAPRYELYDLTLDPRARTDVAAEHPAELVEMKALLAREKARRESARQNARPPTRAVELSAESIAQLESLGYSGK